VTTPSGQITGVPLPDVPQPCAYLPGRRACFEHYQLLQYDDAAFCRLLEQGFRHFGSYFFRPACRGLPGEAWCGACVPLRVPVATFTPSRSQRRVLRLGAAVEMSIAEPEFTTEKFELYKRHKERFARTTDDLQLPPEQTMGTEDAGSFRFAFYEGSRFTRECTLRLDGRLIGVGFLDVASRLASSIYFFFDPDHERLSPGTLSVLREIEYARQVGLEHYYLGYLIRANPSMRYKAAFRPNEAFDGRAWRALRGADGRYLANAEALRVRRQPRLV
jgi:leucyl-tRNA---protein transferase